MRWAFLVNDSSRRLTMMMMMTLVMLLCIRSFYIDAAAVDLTVEIPSHYVIFPLSDFQRILAVSLSRSAMLCAKKNERTDNTKCKFMSKRGADEEHTITARVGEKRSIMRIWWCPEGCLHFVSELFCAAFSSFNWARHEQQHNIVCKRFSSRRLKTQHKIVVCRGEKERIWRSSARLWNFWILKPATRFMSHT